MINTTTNSKVNINSTKFENPFDHWKLDIDDVVMILEHYHDLSTGSVPDNPPEFANPESQKSRNSHAPFESTSGLCAEVCRRVRVCQLDGYLVEERYGLNKLSTPKSVDKIAEERGLDPRDVLFKINKVLLYCTGRNKKKETYRIWCDRCRYRQDMKLIT